jgi:multiple sugar transport system substrate-binding protein
MGSMKKLSRREFLHLAAVVGTGAVLAACGAQDAEEPMEDAPGGEPAEKEAVRISFWSGASPSDPAGEAQYQIGEDFNEEHRGEMSVDYVYTPTTGTTQLSEKLMTNIAAGTPPEAAYFDRFLVATWGAEGALTDISDLAGGAGITKDDYFEFAWTEASWRGRLYALPFQTDDRAIYFNKDHLEEAGFPTDRESFPTSIEEFDAMAEVMTVKEGPRYVQLGFIPWLSAGRIYNYALSFGADVFDPGGTELRLDDPAMIYAAEWMRTYAEQYGVEAVAGFAEGFGGEAQQEFTAGLMSMEYSGSWMLNNHNRYNPDLNYDVVPMPYPQGGRESTMCGGWSVVIPNGAQNVEAGFEFISYFASPEKTHEYCMKNSNIPTQKAYADDPFYTSDPKHKVFMDLLPHAFPRPPVPVGQMVWNELRRIEDLMSHGEGDPKELLTKLNEDANAEMQEYL